MNRTTIRPFGWFYGRRQHRLKGLALLVACVAQANAAEPFLDDNGYYWSATATNSENPVIQDRAELQKLTDGHAQWVYFDGVQNLVKPANGKFYEATTNQRLDELVNAVRDMRARNQQTEGVLEQTLRNSVQLGDAGRVSRFNDLIVRLRRGEKGAKIEQAMNEFIVPADTKRLLDQRDRDRQAAFDALEQLNQRLRLEFGQLIVVGQVKSMVVSERAMVVAATPESTPLPTDDAQERYSESLGITYRLLPQGDGTFYAVLTNKPQPGSAGDTLELLLGDAITAINDRPLQSAADLEKVTAPQTIVTVAKQFDGKPNRLVVQYNAR